MLKMEILGLVSAALLILPYILLNLKKISLRGFNVTSFVSSILMLPYGYYFRSPTVIIINIFWTVISGYFLLPKGFLNGKPAPKPPGIIGTSGSPVRQSGNALDIVDAIAIIVLAVGILTPVALLFIFIILQMP